VSQRESDIRLLTERNLTSFTVNDELADTAMLVETDTRGGPRRTARRSARVVAATVAALALLAGSAVAATTGPRAATAPAPVSAPAAAATMSPMWRGDFDAGNLSQYLQVLNANAGAEPGKRIFLDGSRKLGGAYSARFELRPGDVHEDGTNRIQLRGVNYGNHYFNEGEDRYFRWAIYVDPSTTIGASFSNPWRAIVAWPSVQDGAFSPMKYFLQRSAGNGASPRGTDSITMGGDLGRSGANDVTQWSIPVRKGQWYEFITHWKFSANPSTGLVEHWLKAPGSPSFVKQTFRNGSQTLRMKTLSGAGATSNLRMGLYRNKAFSTIDRVNYDNVYMGTSLASVGG
jgi:hypothetical protein